MITTDVCGNCIYFKKTTSQCHGLPPTTFVFKNRNDDLIFEQARPYVSANDLKCSLFN